MKRKSITLPEKTKTRGLKNARLRGFATSFSAYVAKLIDDDDLALATTGKARKK